MNGFQDKTILISGGSSGIGLAVAEKFIKLGSNVVLIARDKKKLQNAKEHLDRFKIGSGQLF